MKQFLLGFICISSVLSFASDGWDDYDGYSKTSYFNNGDQEHLLVFIKGDSAKFIFEKAVEINQSVTEKMEKEGKIITAKLQDIECWHKTWVGRWHSGHSKYTCMISRSNFSPID